MTGYLSREKVFVGQSIQQLSSSPDWGSYSKVILKTDEGEGYVAGDDTGLTLEAECPYANQAIADAVLASLQGKSYKPYDGSSAYITPAAEIGDGMTSDGFYSGIYSMSRKFSKVSAADIAAPSDTEVQHEIQYEPQSERKFTRKMKEISAEFAVKMDKVYTKVISESSSFGWELTDDNMSWYANGSPVMKVSASGLEVLGKIKASSEIEAGSLTIAGTAILASTLRDGADSGYNWANGAYGSSNSRWDYSLTGGGYGFNFNSASTLYTQSYPSYFRCGMLQLSDNTIVSGTVRVTINGTAYRLVGFETT